MRGQTFKLSGSYTNQWTKCALTLLQLYLVRHSRQRFICEDVVKFAQGRIDSARDNRAWGPVFQMACKKKLIKKTRAQRRAITSHRSFKPVWVGM